MAIRYTFFDWANVLVEHHWGAAFGRPRWEAPPSPAAHFYILTVGESRIGIQGCMKGVVFFTRVTGGAGGAASNGGVPVLWGRGGGSVTGNIF